MEPVFAAFLTFGVLLLMVSWGLLIIVSFQDDFTWGLSTLFLPPLAYFYGLFVWDKAKEAEVLALGGCALIVLSCFGS